MAKVVTKKSRPGFVQALLEALVARLDRAGISAEVDSQRVRGTRLHRVTVLSPQFEHLRPSERQDLAWRIAREVLTLEQQMRISMILTLTPDSFDVSDL